MKIETMLKLRQQMSELVEMMDREISDVKSVAKEEEEYIDEINKLKDNGEDVKYKELCAKRFGIRTLERGEIFTGTRASGAIRRKSMDVSNLLVKLRKGV